MDKKQAIIDVCNMYIEYLEHVKIHVEDEVKYHFLNLSCLPSHIDCSLEKLYKDYPINKFRKRKSDLIIDEDERNNKFNT